MSTIPALLESAVEHHRAGRLEKAAAAYREVLDVDPEQPDALHLLGVTAAQSGDQERARELIEAAIMVRPEDGAAHNDLATVYRSAGKISEAEACYRRGLEIEPDAVLTHCNLAGMLLELGRLEEAMVHYQRAATLAPDSAKPQNGAGLVCQRRGDTAAAVACFQLAVDRDPNAPESHFNLGNAYRAQHRLEEARNTFLRALALRPDYADAHNNLGEVHAALGTPEEALRCFRRVVELNPDSAAGHMNLGNAFKNAEQPDEAVAAYEHALRLKPDYAEAHSNLGKVLADKKRFNESIMSLNEALRIDPALVDAHRKLGQVHRDLGRMEDAAAYFRKAIELDPRCIDVHVMLASSRRFSHADRAEVQIMERLLAAGDLEPEQRRRLNFALGKAWDDLGEWDRAFAYYRQANELAGMDLEPEPQAGLWDEIERLCTRSVLERGSELGRSSDVPVLIVGMPRSGTTLLEQILASHPRIYGAGELPTLNRMAAELPTRLGRSIGYAAGLAGLTPTLAHEMADEYLEVLRDHGAGASRVTDKMPANFIHLGLFALLFPRGRVIHCRRQALDVCLSCYFQDFAQREGLAYTFDLRMLGLYCGRYERLMAHWRRALPVAMLEIDYEYVVREPEAASRRMVDFCGLEWDPGCLRFHETRRAVQTASSWQVRQPLYSRSVDRWKHYEGHLEPLIEALGSRNPH